MAGLSNEEMINQMVAKITAELQSSHMHMDIYKAAQADVMKSSIRLSDLKRGIIGELTKSGWEKKLRNAVYQELLKSSRMQHPMASPEHHKESVAYIRKAQMTWEKRILKSLNSMCTELAVPLARKRPEKDQKDMLAKWTELGTEEPDLTQFRPVYAPKDFLEVIASLRNSNLTDNLDTAGNVSGLWGMVQVSLPVKDMHDLRVQFSEMSINQCQTGVDDSTEIPIELFETERSRLAKKVISIDHSPLAQEFAKKSIPMSSRAKIWCQIFNVHVDDVDNLYYDQLKTNVIHHDLLVDNLIYKDVKLTATNDDQYFVFEDYIYQILLPFSRDTTVLKYFKDSSATPAKSYIRGKLGVEDFTVTYPPNGVIPFHGFSMYVVPLCYVYDDPVVLYYVFREFYTRYFCHLHTLSSHSQGILSLCLLFESLLQTHEPQLFYHLKSVGIQPLRVAFKWLIRGFSGYLSSDQVLLLWDRILAYNSMELFSILALSIFSFRKTNLMQVQTLNAAEGVLADISTLQVIPMIQLTLFSQ